MYDPKRGAFDQFDTVGYDAGPNGYGYVGGDPVNATDPAGTCTGSRIENPDGTCKGAGGYTQSFADYRGGTRPRYAGPNGAGGRNLPAATEQAARAPFTIPEQLSDEGVHAVGLPPDRLDHIVIRHIRGLNEQTGKADPRASIFYARDRNTLTVAVLKAALSSPTARAAPNPRGDGMVVTARLPYPVGETGITKTPTNNVLIVLRPVAGPIGNFFGWYNVWTAYPVP
jgi:hypothetical protein